MFFFLYLKIQQFILNATKVNPEWTELIEAGKSYEGRKIIGLRINTPYEKGQRETGKPVFFIESGENIKLIGFEAILNYKYKSECGPSILLRLRGGSVCGTLVYIF